MGLIDPELPALGQPNSTEDVDLRNTLVEILSLLNGSLDNENIAADATIDHSKIDLTEKLEASDFVTAVANALVPVGATLPYAGAAAPSGYLLCNGAAVSRTTQATLFAAIGTNYGVGDGSTTFNLPDLQGRMPVGKGVHVNVDALNDNDGIALADRTPHHSHAADFISVDSHTHAINMTSSFESANGNIGGGGVQSVALGGHTHSIVGTTGAETPGVNGNTNTNAAPFIVINYIIKT